MSSKFRSKRWILVNMKCKILPNTKLTMKLNTTTPSLVKLKKDITETD